MSRPQRGSRDFCPPRQTSIRIFEDSEKPIFPDDPRYALILEAAELAHYLLRTDSGSSRLEEIKQAIQGEGKARPNLPPDYKEVFLKPLSVNAGIVRLAEPKGGKAEFVPPQSKPGQGQYPPQNLSSEKFGEIRLSKSMLDEMCDGLRDKERDSLQYKKELAYLALLMTRLLFERFINWLTGHPNKPIVTTQSLSSNATLRMFHGKIKRLKNPPGFEGAYGLWVELKDKTVRRLSDEYIHNLVDPEGPLLTEKTLPFKVTMEIYPDSGSGPSQPRPKSMAAGGGSGKGGGSSGAGPSKPMQKKSTAT
ncbi:hypothetical protein VTK26DRAFT_2829 [Humicola hyalothermophila]